MSDKGPGIWKRPLAWLIFVAVCAGGALFATTYFSAAFPVVALDISMDREAALASAAELAERFGWGPDDRRQAASFGLQPEVQEFLELEGGGPEAFRDALERSDFHPYRWRVRHFREMERNETTVSFAPDGTPYGFREQLAEDAAGPSLSVEEARTIAERAATEDWNVDLDAFEPIEASQETLPGGRTDHTFVYQRSGVQYNEGRLRLRLVVAGDHLGELTHFLDVPEAFTRRYAEMRSTNTLIGAVAQIAVFLGYLFAGCSVALFFLYRERWILSKKPVIWGVFIAFLQLLVVFNQLPLAWMGYDTALSSGNFLIQQVGIALLNFLLFAGLLTVTFMAAEGLTRKAFPQQVRLWRVWSPGVANTATIAGQTIAGYLLLGVFFAFEVFLYYLANNWLGWWTPSSAMIQPDVLAAYFPWLSAIAISLQAGFWEECLFRAVPLAGAVILGRRFGRPRIWLIGAFVLQAVIFGAAHAPYPTQPAYARVVELIVPSIGFGLIYVFFGLLPAIVLHYAFDVVWFAMPLFASSAPGVWVDRSILIALALVPAGVVLLRAARSGGFATLPAEALNGAWRPPPEAPPAPAEAAAIPVGAMSPVTRRLLPVAGLAGLVVWVLAGGLHTQSPPVEIGKNVAIQTARDALAGRGIELGEEWRTMAVVTTAIPNQQHRFVWQEGDAETFEELRGSYLRQPMWAVRFARFEGDVADRAEEYWVVVGPGGEEHRFVHYLAEEQPGADLNEDQARGIAGRAVREELGLALGDATEGGLTEVSAETNLRPERRDWTFIFENPDVWELQRGSARVRVEVAGDEVSEIDRFVFVPEEWSRSDRDRYVVPDALAIGVNVLVVLFLFAGAGAAGVSWARGSFDVRSFLVVLAAVVVLGTVTFANSWPVTMAGFTTTSPIGSQVVLQLAGLSIAVIGMGMVLGLLAGWLRKRHEASGATSATLTETLLHGAALGLAVAGLRRGLTLLDPSLQPPWATFDGAGSYVPWLAAALSPLNGLITTTLLVLLVCSLVHARTGGWTQHRNLAVAGLLLFGFVVTANDPARPAIWLLSGLLLGAVGVAAYVWVIRFDLALLPAAVAAAMVPVAVRQAIVDPYPGARLGAALAVLLLVAGAAWAVATLHRAFAAGSSHEPPAT